MGCILVDVKKENCSRLWLPGMFPWMWHIFVQKALCSLWSYACAVSAGNLAQPQPKKQFGQHCWYPLRILKHLVAPCESLHEVSLAWKSWHRISFFGSLSLSSTQTLFFFFFLINVEGYRLNGEKVFFGSRTVIPKNNNAKLESKGSKINNTVQFDSFSKCILINTHFLQGNKCFRPVFIFVLQGYSSHESRLANHACAQKAKGPWILPKGTG